MSKDPRILVEEILDSITKIEQYIGDKSYEDFVGDAAGQDAVIRRLAIIGEAIGNMPSDVRQKFPAIPWQKITGMRNILIHEYADVDIKRVWATVRQELPKLMAEVAVIQNFLSKQSYN